MMVYPRFWYSSALGGCISQAFCESTFLTVGLLLCLAFGDVSMIVSSFGEVLPWSAYVEFGCLFWVFVVVSCVSSTCVSGCASLCASSGASSS